ncbi:HIT domain-containing protein [Parvularcula sp. LCG005]|uniref:HIT domain-containing protein n=1 Tax=Parvularcula sp. LCG005 TaxID=3078805 RepID=UPI0029432293|nr:HIT domain-containing protein [Parvularcula sp. LCG005]WOI52298.1 HIT domain-containing protein [Parvularcula sp. LCG005]
MNSEVTTETSNHATFQRDYRLEAETLTSISLKLSDLLLRNEARFPWLVLIPRRVGARETFDLLPSDRDQLWDEINRVGAALKTVTGAAKINTALFGNMVPQLHVHIIARTPEDPAWPASAVGFGAPSPYCDNTPPDWWSMVCAAVQY